MKAVIYSGGTRRQNHQLNKELIALLEGSNPHQITYVPIDGDEVSSYFKKFKSFFKPYGFKKFIKLNLNRKNSKKVLTEAFKSQVIFFAGGNTYELMKNIKESGFSSEIKKFVRRGGIIAGESAGVISLSPSINMAAIPSIDADLNDVGLKSTKGLGIFDFEFSPHYISDTKSDREIKDYSQKISTPIYACDDGDGIVVNNDTIYFIGRVWEFKKGRKNLII